MAASVSLGMPRSLSKLVKRQTGDVFVPLPTGTVISDGDRKWTLSAPSRRVMGPDDTLTSLLRFEGDAGAYVITREGYDLALLPVDAASPHRVTGAVWKAFKDALLFFPGDFQPAPDIPMPTSHRNLVRLMWSRASADVRRDLLAEERVREHVLLRPHVQAPLLLWLLGGAGLEATLNTASVASGTGAAGDVSCWQAEQPTLGVRQLHVVLKSVFDGAAQVRMRLPYAPGGATWGSRGFEYRELPGAEGQACPVNSQLSAFAANPTSFDMERLIFSFPAASNDPDGWRLLREHGIVQDETLRAVWAALPDVMRTRLGPWAETARKEAKRMARGLSGALRNGPQDPPFRALLQEALDRWKVRSVASRLYDAANSAVEMKQTLNGTLLRSYRQFTLALARLSSAEGEGGGMSEERYLELVNVVNSVSPMKEQQ